jgi:hypothetical protein
MTDIPQQAEDHFPKIDKAHSFIKGIIESLFYKAIGVERNAKIGAKPAKKKK